MNKLYIEREVMEQALNFVTSDHWGTTPYMDMRVYDDASKLAKTLRAALSAAAEPVPAVPQPVVETQK